MESRQKQLAVLSKHIEEANDRINKVLDRLGWTREHVKQKYKERDQLQTCPINKRHKVPSKSFNEHYKRCLLKSSGFYIKKKRVNKASPQSSLFFYKDSPSVISFITQDENTCNTVQESEIDQEKTVDERRQEYDNVVLLTQKLRAQKDVNKK
ncbi:hypothetical protein G6F70_004246 [Rhizopus microsporus]|uniref:CHHC U11-48K-type domain-containing protein n=2 Tax=Rhizopus TaxID=4842 RepID=A0A367J3A5_RHIAZ|nr:hypothetical protein G6F71_004189 [Rhizopus microsporus]RCH84211.1 hypothetical protein CU097_008229 [Rhizopus azygosporus]KAG1200199.1 hypothetical protein G6F70_004246 [Rhizopus microsporus]KAG1212184.1 hypothetical protein G6F69_003922 [Rhizopus microsporus]KAG1227957.1 hypothetical protein G6F67_008127 [Rhizopus microsporus]